MNIKTAALFLNSAKEQSQKVCDKLARHLDKEGISYYRLDSNLHDNDIKEGTDIIFCLGGDGTLLKAARTASGRNIKMMGINGGSLGFLSAGEADTCFEELINTLREDDFIETKRLMLDVKIMRAGAEIFAGKALNECIIKTSEPRVISINIFYDNYELKEYFGDGAIIATPTGSTAYSLAAGGPIVAPGLDVFILTPICPHTLTQRPLVLPADKILRARLSPRKPGIGVAVNLDGQVNFPIENNDDVIISQSGQPVYILYPKSYNYFKVLTTKLKWGSR